MRSLVLDQVVIYCFYVMPKQKITVHYKQLPNLLDNMAATSLHLLLPKSHLTKLQKPHQNLHKDLQMPVKRFCSIDTRSTSTPPPDFGTWSLWLTVQSGSRRSSCRQRFWWAQDCSVTRLCVSIFGHLGTANENLPKSIQNVTKMS